MKKFFYFIVILSALIIITPKTLAANEADIYFFYSVTCPHCAEEKKFLQNLSSEIPEINIHSYEISMNKTNLELMMSVGNEIEANISGVPFTVIGEQTFSGYLNDETTGEQIKQAALQCLENTCPDIVGGIIDNLYSTNQNSNTNQNLNQNQNTNTNVNQNTNQETKQPTDNEITETNNGLLEKITLPVFGEINIKKYSLPVLTIIIGALDGFNPCAMWVLLFLISLLLGMENRRRMWILGGTFIIASAAVYFVFMAAWLNVLLFLGFIIWIRIIIGIVALGSGGYHLREYWKNKDGTCKVTKSERRHKIFDRLKEITQNNKFFLALFGIILLAFAVNLVELICSAGLPAIYTQILALSNLPTISYYLYISLYIFIFMLDDLLIFVIAMVTLRATGLTTKYIRASNLIGGILMLLLGVLLLFKPEWLMFG